MHPIVSSGKEQSSTIRLDDFIVPGKQPGEEKVALRVSVRDRGGEEERPNLGKDIHPVVPYPPLESFPGLSSSRDREPTPSPTTAKADVSVVPLGFFDRIIDALTEFVGPMARVMLNDQVRDLGENLAAFPQARLGKLIELVSREIADNNARVRFQKQLAAELRIPTSS